MHIKTNEGLAIKTLATLQTHEILHMNATRRDASAISLRDVNADSNRLTASDKRIIELEAQVVLQRNLLDALRGTSELPPNEHAPVSFGDKRGKLREVRGELQGFRFTIKSIREELISCTCVLRSSFKHSLNHLSERIKSFLENSPDTKAQSQSHTRSREIHAQIDELRTFVSEYHQRTYVHIVEEISRISSASEGRISHLEDQLRSEISLRRKLHNQLIELRGSIRVFARIRPFLTEEIFGGSMTCVKEIIEDTTLVLTSLNDRQFSLDKVFGPNTTNSELFGDLSQLIVSSMDGYNVSIIAYGATNSGKTYTMNSIYERIGTELFDGQRKRYPWKYTLSVSVCEIYMDSVNDLLDLKNMNVDIRINPQNGFLHVPGLSRRTLTSPEQFTETLKSAARHRAVSSTNCNEHSSRSHLVTQVHLEIVTPNGRAIDSSIHLVDLAGSERLGKSGASGVTAKEAQFINKSLSAFADVVHARFNKSSHVPYRNSILTSVLNESLGGESKTLVIVQLNPSQV